MTEASHKESLSGLFIQLRESASRERKRIAAKKKAALELLEKDSAVVYKETEARILGLLVEHGKRGSFTSPYYGKTDIESKALHNVFEALKEAKFNMVRRGDTMEITW